MQSLAEEATRAFYANLQELGVADAVLLAAQQDATDSALLTLHIDMVRSYPTQLILVSGARGWRVVEGWGCHSAG